MVVHYVNSNSYNKTDREKMFPLLCFFWSKHPQVSKIDLNKMVPSESITVLCAICDERSTGRQSFAIAGHTLVRYNGGRLASRNTTLVIICTVNFLDCSSYPAKVLWILTKSSWIKKNIRKLIKNHVQKEMTELFILCFMREYIDNTLTNPSLSWIMNSKQWCRVSLH